VAVRQQQQSQSPDDQQTDSPHAHDTGGADVGQPSLSRMVLAVVADVRDVSSAWMDLVNTEAKVALSALITMAALGVGALMVVIFAWLFLVGAAVAFATSLGMPLSLAILIAALVHMVAAAIMGFIVMRLGKRLTFPQTRQAISARMSEQNDDGHDDGHGAPGGTKEHDQRREATREAEQ